MMITMTTTRSPAQDIPDIYWEQAARELDFCTCRKCQVSHPHLLLVDDVMMFLLMILLMMIIAPHSVTMALTNRLTITLTVKSRRK